MKKQSSKKVYEQHVYHHEYLTPLERFQMEKQEEMEENILGIIESIGKWLDKKLSRRRR